MLVGRILRRVPGLRASANASGISYNKSIGSLINLIAIALIPPSARRLPRCGVAIKITRFTAGVAYRHFGLVPVFRLLNQPSRDRKFLSLAPRCPPSCREFARRPYWLQKRSQRSSVEGLTLFAPLSQAGVRRVQRAKLTSSTWIILKIVVAQNTFPASPISSTASLSISSGLSLCARHLANGDQPQAQSANGRSVSLLSLAALGAAESVAFFGNETLHFASTLLTDHISATGALGCTCCCCM
jgi:hypothetical protein